jgi:hypothetical protein
VARDAARFQPVFVLTTARSYSSVVTTMIGQHPELMALPELKLFAYDTIAEMQASLPRYWIERGMKHRSPGLVRAIGHYEFGGQTPDALTAAREWLDDRADWSGAEVLDFLLERIAPRAGVEKSPENVESDESLRRLADAYPRARYVHLTRHPVTTQRSMAEHASRTVPGFSLPGQPMAGIASWLETHCRIVCFCETLPEGRFLRVRAEDVLNGGRSPLRSIAAWLGVRADDGAIEAMTHPEASPFACPGPPDSGILGGNDPGFQRDPLPRAVEAPPALEQPAGWDGNDCLWKSTVHLAGRLGYR